MDWIYFTIYLIRTYGDFMIGDEDPGNKHEGKGRNIFIFILIGAAGAFFYYNQNIFWNMVKRFHAVFDLFL